MGGEKTVVQNSSTTTPTATPQENELNQLSIDRIKANRPNQLALDTSMYETMQKILQGQSLPNNLQGIVGVGEGQTQDMVNASIRDIMPQFQSSGILDSGAAAQIASRTAADVRNQNAQFNVGAISQLFNQALGGGSNLGSSFNQQTGQLGSQLSGLRTINQTGSQSTIGMNPFLKSLQTSVGTNLGANLNGPNWLSAARG